MKDNNNEVVVDDKQKKAETKAMIQAISAVVVIAIVFIYFMYFHEKPATEENNTNDTNVTENVTVPDVNETNTTETNETETNETETNETETNETINPEENTTSSEMKEFEFKFTEPCLADLDKKTTGFDKYSVAINNIKLGEEDLQLLYDVNTSKNTLTLFINNKVVSQRVEKEKVYKICIYDNNLIISYDKPIGYVNDIVGSNGKLKANFDGLYTYLGDNKLNIRYASFVNAKDKIAYYYEDTVNISTFETKNVKKNKHECDNLKETGIEEDELNLINKVCTNPNN